jgi:hypothetical protein
LESLGDHAHTHAECEGAGKDEAVAAAEAFTQHQDLQQQRHKDGLMCDHNTSTAHVLCIAAVAAAAAFTQHQDLQKEQQQRR